MLKHFGSVEHFLVMLGEAPDATTDLSPAVAHADPCLHDG
ncbi:MAG: hypothetical protein AVDCRST_MAG76-591 [uncultured Acidimicrobiales bacterium]|uniref:Uncharacterized protein n=1 Tax=uncultured Acidimicrobiales bacterium TaxID=310071 RepID=A0A6J4HEU4_9ACTN|nr:MAG: hypothetical protein AVDCRST_MAG76-591 [uncultured Acidimicrobiales bacterium]